MKRGLLVFAAVMLFSACDEKPKNPVAVHGDRMIDAYHKAQDIRDEANLRAVQSTLQAYRATNDRFPQDLSEITPMLSSDLDLSQYNYDPANGTVSINKK